MAGRRLDRRELLLRATAAGLTLALPGCAGGGAERVTGSPATRRRAAGGRSLRDLADAVKGRVITRDSHGYRAAARVYNERYDGARPLAIVEARGVGDVRAAVAWAGRREVRVVPRSGGHSYAGYSTGDGVLVVDVARLRSVRVDRGRGTATIEAGAQLIDVYAALARHGATIPAGSCPSVGIAGLALGGGVGLASRKLGLTCDNLREVAIVTADGELREASERGHRDLHWACRGGGGGNFGVATSFELRVHRVDRAAYFFASWPWSAAADALDAWQRFAPRSRDELTSIFHLQTGGGAPSVTASGQFFGTEAELGRLLAPLREVGGASITTGSSSYLDLMRRWAGCLDQGLRSCHTAGTRPGGTNQAPQRRRGSASLRSASLERARFVARSDYVDRRLSGRGRRAMVRAIERRQRDPSLGSGALILDAYGGAINRVAPDATAFVHRDALFSIQYLAYYGSPAAGRASRDWIDSAHHDLRHHVSGMAYQNYIDPKLRDWKRAYYGANYRRLAEVKARYDPERRFDFPQAIRPA